MIKKLRFKFVLINMTIVTLMLAAILGLVYFFTRANLEGQSIRMMQSIATQPSRLDLPDQPGQEVRLPYITFRLGPKGERIATGGGYFDLSDEQFLDSLVNEAVDSPKRLGVLPRYNLRYCLVDGPQGRYLVFADISSEINTLRGLLTTCLVIGALGFLGFLGLSILLSGWAVRPVDRAWKQQKRFVADASHELKTPLTVIMTGAELMESPAASEETRKKASSSILTMAQQMKELIEEMLELARADSAEQKQVFAPVDLSKTLFDAILPFEPVFFEKGLRLESELQPEIRVQGGAAQLRRLLEILLDNAQKYAREGGAVWVRLQTQGRRQCLLTVSNEGEPFSEEQLQSMFKRFYRADEARSRTGSFGLGLAIAKGTVDAHRGRIWAESKNGVNTYFVELPRL